MGTFTAFTAIHVHSFTATHLKIKKKMMGKYEYINVLAYSLDMCILICKKKGQSDDFLSKTDLFAVLADLGCEPTEKVAVDLKCRNGCCH